MRLTFIMKNTSDANQQKYLHKPDSVQYKDCFRKFKKPTKYNMLTGRFRVVSYATYYSKTFSLTDPAGCWLSLCIFNVCSIILLNLLAHVFTGCRLLLLFVDYYTYTSLKSIYIFEIEWPNIIKSGLIQKFLCQKYSRPFLKPIQGTAKSICLGNDRSQI